MKNLFKNKDYKIKENGKVIITGDVDMEDIFQKTLQLFKTPIWTKNYDKFGNPIYIFQKKCLNPTILVKNNSCLTCTGSLLTSKDAEDFIRENREVVKVSIEEKEQIRASYEALKGIAKFNI